MSRRIRGALALVLAGAVVAVLLRLALWQWDRAQATGRFLNYSYAAEWLLFAVLTVIGFVRLAVDDRRAGDATGPDEVPVARAAPLTPQVGPPLREGEQLEELTWVRLRRRLGLEGR